MNLEKVNSIYFLGIGGIGMSALAGYFHHFGKEVMGYDRVSGTMTKRLEAQGIAISYQSSLSHLPEKFSSTAAADDVMVIYTPAIPKNHEQLVFFEENNYPLFKRSEVLGMISKQGKTIAVAGTHGKTSTSTLIAHLLTATDFGCNAFLGGVSVNYDTNLILKDKHSWNVVEADEYDRSFLQLHPDIAVITSVDADHLDIYGSDEAMRETYHEFAHQVVDNGTLLTRSGVDIEVNKKVNQLTYGIDAGGLQANHLRVEDGKFVFEIAGKGLFSSVMPGKHNVENALAAIGVAMDLGIHEDKIRAALETYEGVKRRFEYHIRMEDLVLIEDYAHHPEEIKACVEAVRMLYPNKKITGVFQPHLYSRTQDFASGFAEALGGLDELVLLDIYPAREEPIPGITSDWLLNQIQLNNKIKLENKSLANHLTTGHHEVIVMMGAGDIEHLVPEVKSSLLVSR